MVLNYMISKHCDFSASNRDITYSNLVPNHPIFLWAVDAKHLFFEDAFPHVTARWCSTAGITGSEPCQPINWRYKTEIGDFFKRYLNHILCD